MIEADSLSSRQYLVILEPKIMIHDPYTVVALHPLGILNVFPQLLEMPMAL